MKKERCTILIPGSRSEDRTHCCKQYYSAGTEFHIIQSYSYTMHDTIQCIAWALGSKVDTQLINHYSPAPL